jgi:hypothetical protein
MHKNKQKNSPISTRDIFEKLLKKVGGCGIIILA